MARESPFAPPTTTTSTTPPLPFASPNAIPPRSSSYGIANPAGKTRASVLRPLSEIDWLGQSSNLKDRRASGSVHPAVAASPPRVESHSPKKENTMASSNTHIPTSNMSSQYTNSAAGPTPVVAEATPSTNTEAGAQSNGNGVRQTAIYGSHKAWTDDKERILLGPYDYLLGHPGKDIRSQFIAGFNKWLQVPEERLEVITRVIGMLHTASLLVDDVQDSSVLRRGIPVANSIFGVAQTINSANYVYFKALQDVAEMGNPKLIQIFTDELLNLHRGQGMELYWRDSLTCPTEADYLEMVGNKTGGLFRLAVKLMMAESEVDIDCTPLVSTVGILFQILDDHLNLSPTSGYSSLKGICEDLTEGKFSFPVIHAIRADPSNHVLMNILKQKTTDEEVKRYALKYMEAKGSFEYSKSVIEGLRKESYVLIGDIEGQLGEQGKEGADALKKVLEKLVLK